jgi:hypothetical protein
MRLLKSIAFIITILFTSGCELHQIRGEIAGVEVEAETQDGNRGFCPPGQAKKGNC